MKLKKKKKKKKTSIDTIIGNDVSYTRRKNNSICDCTIL